jgi:alkylhydroperoxidase family enzyme
MALSNRWKELGDSRLASTLRFLEILTSEPERLTPDEFGCLLANDVSRDAIVDAVAVCAGFNVINRIADALAFELPSRFESYIASKYLIRIGYKRLYGLSEQEAFHRRVEQQELFFANSSQNSAVARRLLDGLSKLVAAVVMGSGSLDSGTRVAAFKGQKVPAPVKGYVELVHNAATSITNDHIRALLVSGLSEDQIFEITVSAALGAGVRRVESALSMLANKPGLGCRCRLPAQYTGPQTGPFRR